MEDFSVIHDRLVSILAPLTNFSNERRSSAVFLALLCAVCLLFLMSDVIPWRAVFLALGWIFTLLLHPSAPSTLDHATSSISHVESIWRAIEGSVLLDEAPEVGEVEIFELQRHRGRNEWQSWVYNTSPFEPLSPARISGDRPRGARFFEDVQPPQGWIWKDKKWTLDLLSREWVEERMISAVEVETEGERWVYDIGVRETSVGNATDGTRLFKTSPAKSDLQEGGSKGDWRRRRWIRLVHKQTSAA